MYQEINFLGDGSFSRSYDRIQELILRKNNVVFNDAYDFCYGLLHYIISQKNPEILEHSDDFQSLVSNKKVLEILKDHMGLEDTSPFSELIYLHKKYNSKHTESGEFIEADVISMAETIQFVLKMVFEFKGIEYEEIDLYPYVVNLLKANQENTGINYGNSNNSYTPEKMKNIDRIAVLDEKMLKERQKEIDEIDKKLNFTTSKKAKATREEKKKQAKLAQFAFRYDLDYDQLAEISPNLNNNKEVINVLEQLGTEEALEEYMATNIKKKGKNKEKKKKKDKNIEDEQTSDEVRLQDATELKEAEPEVDPDVPVKMTKKEIKAAAKLAAEEEKAAKKAEKLAKKGSKKKKNGRELNKELLDLVDEINNNNLEEEQANADFMSDIEKRINDLSAESDLDFPGLEDEEIISFDDLAENNSQENLTGKDYLTNMLESEFNSTPTFDNDNIGDIGSEFTEDDLIGRTSEHGSFDNDVNFEDLFSESQSDIQDDYLDESTSNTSVDFDSDFAESDISEKYLNEDDVFSDDNFILSNAKKLNKKGVKKAATKAAANKDVELSNVEGRKGVVVDTTLLDDVITADKEFSSANRSTRKRIKHYLDEKNEDNINIRDDFNRSLDNIEIDEENALTKVELEKIRAVIKEKGYNKDLNDNLSITLFNSGYVNNEVFHIYNLRNNIDPTSRFRSLYAVLYNTLQKSETATISTYIKSRDLDERQLSEVYKYQMLVLSLVKNGTLNDYNWNINMVHGSTVLMSYAVKDILNSVSHLAKFIGEEFETPKVEIRAKNEIKLLYVNVSFNVKLIDRDVYAILNTKFKSGEDFVVYNKWIEKPVRYVYHKKGFTHQQINSLRLLAYDLLGSYSLSENQINYIVAGLDPYCGNIVAIDDYKKNKPLALFTMAVLQPKLSIIVVKDAEMSDKYERTLRDFYLYGSVANLGNVRDGYIYEDIEDIVNNKPQIILATAETFQLYEFKRLVKKLDNSSMIGTVIVDNAEEIPQRGHTSKVSLLLLSDTLDKVCANAKRVAIADSLQKNIVIDLVSEFNISGPDDIITVEKYDSSGEAIFVSAVYDLNREIDPLRRTHNTNEIEQLYRKELNHIVKLFKELSNKSGKVKIVCNSETKIGNERALYILHKLGVISTWELSFDGDKTILNVISNPNYHSFYYIKKTIEEYITSYTLEDEILMTLKSCASMGELITLFYEWYVYTFINPDLKTVRRRIFDGTLTQNQLSEGNPIKHQVTVLEQKFRELTDGNYNLSFDGFSLNDVIKLASSLDDSLLEEKKHEVEVMLGIIIRKLTVYHSIISLRLGEFDESNARDGLIYALNTLDASDLRGVYRDLAYLYEKLPTAQKIAIIDVLLEVDKDALYKLINVFKNDKVIYSFIVKHISSKINL